MKYRFRVMGQDYEANGEIDSIASIASRKFALDGLYKAVVYEQMAKNYYMLLLLWTYLKPTET